MGKGRQYAPVQRPEAVGTVSDWWFPWQAEPLLLSDGEPWMRKSVYSRPTSLTNRTRRIKDKHRRKHGEWCEGIPEIDHPPHRLTGGASLTVDHIIPLSLGGTNERSNLRVVCLKANLDRHRT